MLSRSLSARAQPSLNRSLAFRRLLLFAINKEEDAVEEEEESDLLNFGELCLNE